MASPKLANIIVLVHPFLFAMLPALITLGDVKTLVLPEECLPALVCCQIFAIVLVLIFWDLSKDIYKACTVASALFAYCFIYRAIDYCVGFLLSPDHASPPAWLSLVVFTILGALVLPALMKTDLQIGKFEFSVNHRQICSVLTSIAAVLLLVDGVPLIAYELGLQQLATKFGAKLQEPFANLSLQSQTKPDIYYIILDGFASTDALERIWHFQNHELTDYLKSKNFYVVPRATSNYDRTEFSLGSSLNMQYINFIPEAQGKTFSDLNLYGRLMNASMLMKLLRGQGYKLINVASASNEYFTACDRNVRCNYFTEFALALGGLTPLFGIEKYLPIFRHVVAENRLCPGHVLDQVCAIPGPKFVFIHTELPHAPVIFDEQGNARPLPTGSYMINWGTPEEYFSQWKFSEREVKKWLETILEKSAGKAVIIVQSDHGSGLPFPRPDDWYNERMKILNAYYLPGMNNQGLYPDITPINSFRVVLNDYFQAKIPLLPDQNWCSPDFSRPYEWSDVRSHLIFDK